MAAMTGMDKVAVFKGGVVDSARATTGYGDVLMVHWKYNGCI